MQSEHLYMHTHKIATLSMYVCVCMCLCMCAFMRVGICVSVFGNGHFAKSTN